MKKVEAFVCEFCGAGPNIDPEIIRKHEVRCNLNPAKKRCYCSLCKYRKKHSYDDWDRHGRKYSRNYYTCTVGAQIDTLFDYCEKYEEDKDL